MINKPKPPMSKSPYLLIFASFFTLISCSTSTTPINYGEKYFVENIDKSRGCGDCDEFWVMEFNGPETGVIYSTPNPFGDLKSCSREFSYERRGQNDFIIHVLEDTVLKVSSEAFRNSKNYYYNTCEDELFGNTYTLGDGLVQVKHYGYNSDLAIRRKAQSQSTGISLETGFLYSIPVSPGDLLPKEELRIKRNEIFARKGYKFDSEDLKEHFSSKPWYKAKTKYVKLSEREKYIVNSIKRLEDLDLTIYDLQVSSNDTLVFLKNMSGSILYLIKDKHLVTIPLIYNLAGDKFSFLTSPGKVKLLNSSDIYLEDLGMISGIQINEAFDDQPYGPTYYNGQIGDLTISSIPLDTNDYITYGPGLGYASLYDNIIVASRELDKNYGLYTKREAELTYDCEDCTKRMSEQAYFNYTKGEGILCGYNNDGYSTFRKSRRNSYKGIRKVEPKFFAACYLGETPIKTSNGDKPIADILTGDILITSEGTAIVDSVVSVLHENLVKITFDNKTELILTSDHPLVSSRGNIVSFNPVATNKLYDNIATCEIITGNTSFQDINGNQLKISKIEPVIGQHKTYTIFSKEKFIYYINGLPTIPEFFNERDIYDRLHS